MYLYLYIPYLCILLDTVLMNHTVFIHFLEVLLIRRIIVHSRDFTELSQKRKFIYDILISKIVQEDRTSNTDCYGIFLMYYGFV